MSQSLIGECHIAGRCLSLDEYRVNEGVGRSGIHEGLQDRIRKVLDVKESVSESGFERADVLRVIVFARGEFNAILGHAESRGLLVFFESEVGGATSPAKTITLTHPLFQTLTPHTLLTSNTLPNTV